MKRKSSDLTVEFKRAAVALMTPGVKILGPGARAGGVSAAALRMAGGLAVGR